MHITFISELVSGSGIWHWNVQRICSFGQRIVHWLKCAAQFIARYQIKLIHW